jgi:hypothetical protein
MYRWVTRRPVALVELKKGPGCRVHEGGGGGVSSRHAGHQQLRRPAHRRGKESIITVDQRLHLGPLSSTEDDTQRVGDDAGSVTEDVGRHVVQLQ